MGGLIVATVLTLLALPAMYAAWFRVRGSRYAVIRARPTIRQGCAATFPVKHSAVDRFGAGGQVLAARVSFDARAGGEIGRRTRFRS